MSNNTLTTGAEVAQFVLPMIPSAISFVEQMFAGGDKKKAAVDLLHGSLTTLANAGKIPSAGVVDPALPAALGDAVQKTFDTMSGGTGKIPIMTARPDKPSPPSPSLSSSNSLVVSGAGHTFLVIEV